MSTTPSPQPLCPSPRAKSPGCTPVTGPTPSSTVKPDPSGVVGLNWRGSSGRALAGAVREACRPCGTPRLVAHGHAAAADPPGQEAAQAVPVPSQAAPLVAAERMVRGHLHQHDPYAVGIRDPHLDQA